MRQTELYVPPKFFEWNKPVFNIDIKKSEDGAVIEISSDVFAKGVYVDFDSCDPVLSENFIDVVNGEKYKIFAKTDTDIETLKRSIVVKSVYDIGK